MNQSHEDKRYDGKQPPFEYNQIDEGVFIGTNACCTSHFEKDLVAKDITVDISLEGEKIAQPVGVDIFIWIPTVDRTAPKKEPVVAAVEALDSLLQAGRKVYIHCKNGHGRGPTFYAAYLRLKKGLSTEEALAKISEKRPSIHPEDVQLDFLNSL